MKKFVIFAVAFFITSWISIAADSLQVQCDQLLLAVKWTKFETLAYNVCNTALGNKTKPTTKPVIKKTKKIGSIPSWTDTSITKEQVKAIVDNSIIKGNAKARFLIIEYSDLQCPFCKRHWDNKTIETVVSKYNGMVASTFRHFPLAFHENALSWALAAQCVALQDYIKYYDFIGWVFWRGLNGEIDLYKTAENLKLDLKRLKDCMLSSTVLNIVNKQTEEGINLFGITGTPGNVILDTVTWKYKPIMGAYPVSEFEEILDKIVK